MTREQIEVRFTSAGTVHLDWPDDPDGSLLLVLHGYGLPLDYLAAFSRAAAPRAVIVAPEGPSSFYRRPRRPPGDPDAIGHGWIARLPRASDDERNDAYLLAALDGVRRRTRVLPERTCVLGFSQGGGVATHLMLEHPEIARGLIVLAGGLATAYRHLLPALRGKDVLWISGTQDPAYPLPYTEALLRAMREADVDVDAHAVESGHDVREPALPIVRDWLRTTGV